VVKFKNWLFLPGEMVVGGSVLEQLVTEDLNERINLVSEDPYSIQRADIGSIFQQMFFEDSPLYDPRLRVLFCSNKELRQILVDDEILTYKRKINPEDSVMCIYNADYKFKQAILRHGLELGDLLVQERIIRETWLEEIDFGYLPLPLLEKIAEEDTFPLPGTKAYAKINVSESTINIGGRGNNLFVFIPDMIVKDENAKEEHPERVFANLEGEGWDDKLIKVRKGFDRLLSGAAIPATVLTPQGEDVSLTLEFPYKDMNYLLVPINWDNGVMALPGRFFRKEGTIVAYIGTCDSGDAGNDVGYGMGFVWHPILRMITSQPLTFGRVQRMRVNGQGYAVLAVENAKHTGLIKPDGDQQIEGTVTASNEGTEYFSSGFNELLGNVIVGSLVGGLIALGLSYLTPVFDNQTVAAITRGVAGFFIGLNSAEKYRFGWALLGAAIGATTSYIPPNLTNILDTGAGLALGYRAAKVFHALKYNFISEDRDQRVYNALGIIKGSLLKTRAIGIGEGPLYLIEE
jgi:hypothetical protein